jgi:myo-inositol-1(or 4)-monophosphatase
VGQHDSDLELLKEAALEAGALAMSFFRRNPDIWEKAGGSPVTEADMAVDAFLHTELLAERPDYGWLSEEKPDHPARLKETTLFVVDPIDGTRAFIKGDPRWCVSLAVVKDHRPVAAALYAPALDELFVALHGGGAWMGEKRLFVSERSELAGARLAGPRGWLRTGAVQSLGADLREHVPSLAYRFASVAAKRLDAAFASPGAHDWDLAACDLLVHEAGGRIAELDGTVPRYNQEIPRHGALGAAPEKLLPTLLATMEKAAREVSRGRQT